MVNTDHSSPTTAFTGVPRPGGPGLLAGRTVSRIGYGAMQLERLHGDRAAALTVLRRAPSSMVTATSTGSSARPLARATTSSS